MGFFTDLITPTSYDVPNAPNIDITSEQAANTASNAASFAGAKDLAAQYNDFMSQQVQKRLAQTFPQFAGLEEQGAKVIGDRLKGVISTSDAATSQRTSAARALSLGTSGSPAGSALTLRDLGIRQYQAQSEGESMLPGFTQTVTGATKAPLFDFSQTFMSPEARVGFQFQNEQNKWNVQNLKNQMSAQPEPWMRALAGQGDSIENLIQGSATTGLGAWAGSAGAAAGKSAAAGGGY